MTQINYLEKFKISSDFNLGFGHFNTIHSGHLRYLRYAKGENQKLVIALIGNLKNNNDFLYDFNQNERAEALSHVDYVDGIILLKKNELHEVIKKLKPQKLVLGTEFNNSKEKEITKAINLQSYLGKPTIFHAGEVNYASTDLLSNNEQKIKSSRINDFKNACKRQSLSLEILLNSISKWEETKLIVLGDTIIDQYSACEALGLSAEAPVVVVKELKEKRFIGGAAIVAAHIKEIGPECSLISVIGDDEEGKFVKKELQERSINDFLIIDNTRPTTFKKRYVVENQKLFRVSRLEDHKINKKIEDKIIQKLEELAPNYHGIVVSDFVYGVITEKILAKINELKNKYNLKIFGDLQCSSQIGFITKFKNFSLLCPNEKEARIALQDNDNGLELLSQNLMLYTSSERLLMKLGSNGFIAYDRKKNNQLTSQQFPALSANPVDVTGAGDSVLAVMSTGLSSKESMISTAAIACCMSYLSVESMGNTPISADIIKKTLKEIFKD